MKYLSATNSNVPLVDVFRSPETNSSLLEAYYMRNVMFLQILGIYLMGKIIFGYNDLLTQNPELAAEWHPTKNGELTPDCVAVHSGKLPSIIFK